MERKKLRINRDEIIRLTFLKNEYVFTLLKSVYKTRTLTPLNRFYAFFIFNKHKINFSRLKNYCILTGRSKGTTKIFNMSRHQLNKKAQFGYVTNFSRNNHK